MADVKVPIKFEIYKGDQLVREEVLAQDVIKIGKLASSHLRLDDETVSRMHAVIEATGPGDVHVVDLGSTRGTTVNGERITKARLQSGDEIMFGDCRVIVTFGDALPAQATPRAAGVGVAAARRPRRRGGFAPPPPTAYAPAAAAAVRSAPPPAYAAPPAAVVRARRRSRARPAPAPRSRSTTARARWRSRPSSAASSPGPATSSTPKGKTTHGQGTSMLYAGLGVAVVGARHVRRHGDGRRRREGPATRHGRRPARSRRPSSGRTARPASAAHRLRRPARRRRRCRTWASSAAARPARTS